MIELLPMSDATFAWLLGDAPAPATAPRVCDGGVAPGEIVALIRSVAAANRAVLRGDVAWLIVADGEAVGMISYTKPGDPPDIGYGVASVRERRGYATAAVAALLPIVRAAGYRGLTAETATDNRASQRVLERNGFTRTGERVDPEDGPLYVWTIGLTDE